MISGEQHRTFRDNAFKFQPFNTIFLSSGAKIHILKEKLTGRNLTGNWYIWIVWIGYHYWQSSENRCQCCSFIEKILNLKCKMLEFGMVVYLSGASITDVIKRTNSGENREKRALGEGCYDDYGRHYSVGQRWRVNGGSCACYRFGTIGCVGEPVTVAPRTLLLHHPTGSSVDFAICEEIRKFWLGFAIVVYEKIFGSMKK